ncbi:hypothetical protein Tco_0853619 [Tanacetum coccineum]
MTHQIFGDMASLPPREQRHPFLRYQGLKYSDADIANFEERLERIYSREIHRVQELILEFHSMLRFGEILLDLDAPDTIQFQLGGARRRLSWRQFILALGLHTGEEMESPTFARDLLGLPPSYTLIRDPMLRHCHWMMAHSIARRSQAPEKILGGLTVFAPELPIIDMAELLRLQIYEQLDDTWA